MLYFYLVIKMLIKSGSGKSQRKKTIQDSRGSGKFGNNPINKMTRSQKKAFTKRITKSSLEDIYNDMSEKRQ